MTRRMIGSSVCCFFLIGAVGVSPVLAAQNTGADGSPAPTIELLPTDSENLFRSPDEDAAISHLAPLRTYAVPAGDIEIRLWQGFTSIRTTGIVLRRRSGVWSGARLMGKSAAVQAVDFTELLPKPEGGWEKLWNQLQTDGILTLPNQKQSGDPAKEGANADSRVTEGIRYLIETNREGIYRGYSYDNPRFVRRQEDQQVAHIAKVVNDAFHSPETAHQYWNEAIAPLPPDVQQHLLHDAFTESRDARDLPDWVRQAFTEEFPDSDFVFVNPGEAYPAGSEPHRSPQRRLSFVAVSGDYCVVACEYKGDRYGEKVLLFHKAGLLNPFAADVYQASSEVRLVPRSLREVRALQAKGRFLQVQDESF